MITLADGQKEGDEDKGEGWIWVRMMRHAEPDVVFQNDSKKNQQRQWKRCFATWP